MADYLITSHKLLLSDVQSLLLSPDATILSVHEERGDLYLWLLEDVEALPVEYTVYVLGTNYAADKVASATGRIFHGTAHMSNGLVWHVFVYNKEAP